jgi:hypothetical protein
VVVASRNVKCDFTPDQAVASPKIGVFIHRDIANNDTGPSRWDGTDFGSVGVGKPGVRRGVTVRNDGGSELVLSDLAVPDGFEIVEPLDAALPVGG